MVYREGVAAVYCRRAMRVFLGALRWSTVTFLCISGLVAGVYLYLDSPAVRHVHSADSYSEGSRISTMNRFTEETFDYRVNPFNFSFHIAEPNRCDMTDEDVFLLVLIHSKPTHVHLRVQQRQTSLSDTVVLGKRITVVYLLGNATGNKYLDDRLVKESRKYRDIVMGNFKDTYYNLTYKFMMGMKWASLFCRKAEYVLKGDDDVFFNLRHIVKMLLSAPSEDFMSGYVHSNAEPYRNKASKWFISEKVYPYRHYPPFCVGYAYVMSGDLPPRLFKVAQHIPFFSLDDVFAGFCARRLDVTPVYKVGFHWPGRVPLSFCNLNLSFAVHFSDSNQIPKVWWEQQLNPLDTSCSVIAYYLKNLF